MSLGNKPKNKPYEPTVIEPDPYWPAGFEPEHLRGEQKIPETVEAFVNAGNALAGPKWKCAKCGVDTGRSQSKPELCVKCAASEHQNTSLARKANSNWMEEAKELGLEIYERQPQETDLEWLIWCTYRSYYPLRLPNMNELAVKVGCATATVVKAVNKWSYKVRMIDWARYTDDTIAERRIEAIKEMNEKQLNMAKSVQGKLADAINMIDPALLKPNEIVNLFKMATELERKITTTVDEKVESTVVSTSNKAQEITKTEDLSEVMKILGDAGLLKGKTIGVETTTRIIAKEDDND